MEELIEGGEWYWTNPFHPIIEDVPVIVENVTESGAIFITVTDTDLLESDLARARETYADNGNDMKNVTEVHPFVKESDDGSLEIDDTWFFSTQERALDQLSS